MLRMAAVTNMTEQLNFLLFTFNSDFLLQSQLTVLQLANFYPHTLTFYEHQLIQHKTDCKTFILCSRLFESVVKYFDGFLNMIPLSFVLGFYVSYVASRWWQQFLAIPWPDKSFHTIALYIPGFDEESRMLRRSLLRWMNLALILVLRSISSAVKQRFPTLDHVVEAGKNIKIFLPTSLFLKFTSFMCLF